MLPQTEDVPLLNSGRENSRSWMKSGLIVLIVIGVVATLQVNRPLGTVDERNAIRSAKVEQKTTENDITNMGNLKLSKSRVGVDACPRGLTNIAEGKMAAHSSTARLRSGINGQASLAVDGNNDGYFRRGSCTHTKRDRYPYWFVNLGAEYDLCKVSITNRRGRARSRLSNFVIFVTNTPPRFGFRASSSEECHLQNQPVSGTEEFDCNKRGRFVGIQLLKREYLTLCEVEVFGTPVSGPTPTTTTVSPGPPSTTASPGECGPRIRRSWYDISPAERDLYISGFKRLRDLGISDVFSDDHYNNGAGVGGFTIHNHINFVPWHRYFILQLEEQIRNLGGKYACFTLPYWDWTRDDLMGDTVGSNPMLTNRYLGGNGWGGCVRNGEFDQDSGYITSEDRCLTRRFNDGPGYAGLDDVRLVIRNSNAFDDPDNPWAGFRYQAEQNAGHNRAHNGLGGYAASHRSPDDPIFYLLHAFVDLYWAARSDCFDFEGTKPVTEQEFPRRALDTTLQYGILSGMDWWPKKSVTNRDMLRTADLGYTYHASTLLTRENGATFLSRCNFNEIQSRDVTADEISFLETSDSVAATVYRQMRESPLPVSADETYCRRTAEKKCNLKRAERLRRGILKRKCHYKVKFDKCGGSNYRDGILIISKQELMDKPGVRGNPCLEEIREWYFDWAEATGTLRDLCNGDYDPSCVR